MEVDFEKTVFFDFQKPSKIKGFRLRMRETANRILSAVRLPIPPHRHAQDYKTIAPLLQGLSKVRVQRGSKAVFKESVQIT
ncbi:MAG: hypothetical protein J6X34_11110 [Clostridia bacterium]|nr:hypothetical protein [Clostridia bacterium]MBP5781765.1 hypothetical protein [Clostridia bacterium]